MAATLTTSTWNLAFDYSDYYERIATALETVAATSTATLVTLNTIASTLTNIVLSLNDNTATTVTILSEISSSLNTIAASSTSTLLEISNIASTSTLINKSLESMAIASIVTAISSTPSGVIDIDAESNIVKGDAVPATQVFGRLPTYNYISTASTSTLAEFEATVGGNTGTWMYVKNIITGTILANMELSIVDPEISTATRSNSIIRQIDGILGNTGTYELRYDTGFKTNLNKGNSQLFTSTAILHTGTEVVTVVSPFGDLEDGLFSTLISTLPKSI